MIKKELVKILKPLIGKHVVHRPPYKFEDRDVVLMAVCGNWSMVRRPGAIPYVCETIYISKT